MDLTFEEWCEKHRLIQTPPEDRSERDEDRLAELLDKEEPK